MKIENLSLCLRLFFFLRILNINLSFLLGCVAFSLVLLHWLDQSYMSAVCPRSFLCAWCQKLHCRGLAVLMTLDGCSFSSCVSERSGSFSTLGLAHGPVRKDTHQRSLRSFFFRGRIQRWSTRVTLSPVFICNHVCTFFGSCSSFVTGSAC